MNDLENGKLTGNVQERGQQKKLQQHNYYLKDFHKMKENVC